MTRWLQRRRQHPAREAGSGIMVFMIVFLIPFTFIFFGVGVDVAVANYTKTALQQNLDAATQSAVSSARNQNGYTTPRLSEEQARNTFINIYEQNLETSSLGWVNCNGDTASGGGCPFDLKSFSVKLNSAGQVTSITASVHQSSTPLFVKAFGIVKAWNYNLISTATQTQAYATTP